jgi:LacI family transcriptional regulator
LVTSHDVAREAGVSQSTVSRVLRGNDRVDAVARDPVLAALEALQYVPNASAKAMRTARAGAIGIVAAEILNPYFPQLLDMITREAKRRDLSVILWKRPESRPSKPGEGGPSSRAALPLTDEQPVPTTSGIVQ